MPPQLLIQGFEQFRALQNLRGDIGDIKKWFINLSLHCLRKKELCEDSTFLRNEATWLMAL